MEWHDIISLSGEILGILAILGITVEAVPPIKVYPITILFKWIGDKMFGDKFKEIFDCLKCLRHDVDTNEVDRLRAKILNFANSVKHGHGHTRDEWEDIFRANDKYHNILERNGETNGYIDREMQYLDKQFQERNDKDSFLK